MSGETREYLGLCNNTIDEYRLPSDQMLRSIMRDIDRGKLTRDAVTADLKELYAYSRVECGNINALIEAAGLDGGTYYNNGTVNRLINRRRGYRMMHCATNSQYCWGREDFKIDRHNILKDIDEAFPYRTTIKEAIETMTKGKVMKFSSGMRPIFLERAVVTSYKNGSFTVMYDQSMHRLNLTMQRYDAKLNKLRDFLEVQDKLNDEFEAHTDW